MTTPSPTATASAAPTPAPAPVPANTQLSREAAAATIAKRQNQEINIAAITASISAAMKAAGKTPEQISAAVDKAYSATQPNVGESNDALVSRVSAIAAAELTKPATGTQAGADSNKEGEEVGGNKSWIGRIVGMLAGGGIGVMIAKFASGFFSDGGFLSNIMGMFLTLALGIGGALMGGNKLGGMINGFFGINGKDADGKDASAQGQGRGQQRTGQSEKLGEIASADIQKVVAEVGNRTDVVRLKWNEDFTKVVPVGVKPDESTDPTTHEGRGVVTISEINPNLGNCSRYAVVKTGAETKMPCIAPLATAPAAVAGPPRR